MSAAVNAAEMVDELTIGDIAFTIAFVFWVVVIFVLATAKPPRNIDNGRVSQRAMRNLIARLDAERAEHPERQS